MKNDKIAKGDGFFKAVRTLHIRNHKIEDAECKTWTQDKIFCARGCDLVVKESCLLPGPTGYSLKLDRVTGEAFEDYWFTSSKGIKTSTRFSGNCKKIEGRKF